MDGFRSMNSSARRRLASSSENEGPHLFSAKELEEVLPETPTCRDPDALLVPTSHRP